MADDDRLATAYRDEDWEGVLRLAPEHPEGTAALMVGMAHWYLGAVAEAHRSLELGLESTELPLGELGAFLYAAGMACLLRTDLPGARRHLLRGLEGPSDDPWQFPTLRGLAQVEMELGLLDAAAHRLRHLPDFGPESMQHVLRAKVAWRAGNTEAARANLWIALRYAIRVEPDARGGDPYPLVDTASLLVSGAEILATMGHGAECHRALDSAAALLDASGAPELPVATHLRLCRGSACRLTGDRAEAERLLDTVEAEMAEDAADIAAAAGRERARLMWDRGDVDGARLALAEAADRFEAIGYAWEAEATRREASTGPPSAVDTDPLEHWFDEDGGFDEPPPVGVVVSLMLPDGDDEALEGMLDFTHALTDRLTDATEGFVDGWGTDGDDFEIFVYGDGPDRLWQAIEAPVRALGLDGTVRLEWGDRFQILLLDPPEDLAGLRRIRPLLPVLSGKDTRTPPLDLRTVANLAKIHSPTRGPRAVDLEWVRSARLERGKMWLWRWTGDAGDYYVTLLANPGVPPTVYLDATEGLSPEQHLISVHFAYRSELPDDLF